MNMNNIYKLGIALLTCLCGNAQDTVTNSYTQINLVSDGSVSGTKTDPNLVNPWGLSRTSGSDWWASDNETGVSTLYDGSGNIQSLVVTILPASGTGKGTPTGTVAVGSTFVFVTLDGTVQQWNGGTAAVIKAIKPGAFYTGCTRETNAGVNTLYAANSKGGVDAYNATTFAPITLAAGSFVYPSLPPGYAPYGIQSVGSKIYVTFTAAPGAGNGYVGVFNTAGTFLSSLAHGKYMNEPWGIAKAPSNFGKFSDALLVGMTGSGEIAAFNASSGTFLGMLENSSGKPIVNTGLWAIYFGGGTLSGPTNWLYFTAGIDGYAHGLFGYFISND
jgi:uncharacterized protein (TIGR03118 family)